MVQKSTEHALSAMAELFKVFGDLTRVRIMCALFDEEISVGEIAKQLSMTQSAISHQLRVLKQADLIRARREGKTMLYSLADDHVKTIIAMGLEHIAEKQDLERQEAVQ